MMERLHPETMRELRQLVRLHGADRLIVAVRQIEALATAEKEAMSHFGVHSKKWDCTVSCVHPQSGRAK